MFNKIIQKKIVQRVLIGRCKEKTPIFKTTIGFSHEKSYTRLNFCYFHFLATVREFHALK